MNAINPAQARVEELRFSFGKSTLGLVLIARSDAGIAAILLADTRDALRDELAEAFPHARLIADDAGLTDAMSQVVAFLDAPGDQTLALPLDMRGSAQQRAVWDALRAIPVGQTTSYGQIAKSLSPPATAQEVAAACAANVLAVAIPCHRVVKADGSISGYRWGVRRKRWLINQEGLT